MLRKIILGLCFLFCIISSPAFADSAPITEQEAKEVEAFFDDYINAANTYQEDLMERYTKDADIKRVVIKPNGTKETVDIPMDRYKKELKRGKTTAKLVKYTNKYLNRKLEKLSESTFKLKAKRFPMKDKKGLDAEFTIVKTPDGYKISEEKMETTVQRFLSEKN